MHTTSDSTPMIPGKQSKTWERDTVPDSTPRGSTWANLSPWPCSVCQVSRMYCQRLFWANLSPALLRSPVVLDVLSEAVPRLTSLLGPAPFTRCGGCTVRGCNQTDLSPQPCSISQVSCMYCQRLYPGCCLSSALLHSSCFIDMLCCQTLS